MIKPKEKGRKVSGNATLGNGTKCVGSTSTISYPLEQVHPLTKLTPVGLGKKIQSNFSNELFIEILKPMGRYFSKFSKRKLSVGWSTMCRLNFFPQE